MVLAQRGRGILAEAGGRQLYNLRHSRYSDYNRVTGSLRQPGSVMKPLVYLAAFRNGLTPRCHGARRAHQRADWARRPRRQVDRQLRRQVQGSDSRSPGAGRVPQRGRGVDRPGHRHGQGSSGPARELGFRTPLQPYISTALGASEVRLLELAGAYRAMASGLRAEPHVIARSPTARARSSTRHLAPSGRFLGGAGLIQEGLARRRSASPSGTAHCLDRRRLPDSGDGQDGDDERFSGRAVRRVHLRAAGHHGRGPDRLRRQPHPGPQGDGRPRGPADLSRDHARASTRTRWSGRCRSSPARSRTGSTTTSR